MFLSVLVVSVNASVRHLERDDITGHLGSTREEVLARRESRKQEFAAKLDQLKQQLDDHESGRFLLQGFETERLKKKVKAYENKLQYLNEEVDDEVSGRVV